MANLTSFSPGRKHDPDLANTMLDELGLTERDEEGFRKAPNGEAAADYLCHNFLAARNACTDGTGARLLGGCGHQRLRHAGRRHTVGHATTTANMTSQLEAATLVAVRSIPP